MLNISSHKINNISFAASAPKNYRKIDDFVSRSAQPNKDNCIWLKEQGVTDVFNFRTMFVPAIDFDEKEFLQNLGIKSHSFPITEKLLNTGDENEVIPILKNIFAEVKQIKESGGKAHWHCKAGVDRTGFVSLIYKSFNNIDTFEKNSQEMLDMGHHVNLYPNIINFAKKIIKKL